MRIRTGERMGGRAGENGGSRNVRIMARDGWIGRASGFLTRDITGRKAVRVTRERADLAIKRHVADRRHVIPSSFSRVR